ncbi:MAG: V-type ATP synthase subunit E [Spirochaetales bacterium]|nr:V-type ATP synthase subunit E [Spirochaetales bacterium]
MDIRVQELLERIKRDGVDSASAEAARIVAEAEAKAQGIITAAEKEAKAIADKARADAARTEEAGKAALVQASRDLLLAFRGQVEQLLATLVKANVTAAFSADTIQKALPAILEAWAKGGSDNLAVLLPEKELDTLEAYFKDALSASLRKGVEFKPLKGTKDGFRIEEKGGAAYYDFSATAVAEMLSAYLNSRLAAIVVEAAK